MPRPPPRSTLFPYTTLFRSALSVGEDHLYVGRVRRPLPEDGLPARRRRPRLQTDRYRRTVGGGAPLGVSGGQSRSEEHTSELQSRGHLVCRLLLEKKKKDTK